MNAIHEMGLELQRLKDTLERVREVSEGLKTRATACRDIAGDTVDTRGIWIRLNGKADAYEHGAQLLDAALGEDDGDARPDGGTHAAQASPSPGDV